MFGTLESSFQSTAVLSNSFRSDVSVKWCDGDRRIFHLEDVSWTRSECWSLFQNLKTWMPVLIDSELYLSGAWVVDKREETSLFFSQWIYWMLHCAVYSEWIISLPRPGQSLSSSTMENKMPFSLGTQSQPRNLFAGPSPLEWSQNIPARWWWVYTSPECWRVIAHYIQSSRVRTFESRAWCPTRWYLSGILG